VPIPLPSYREIVDLLKKGATIEAQEQIMALREAALALQEENFSLREENRQLKESNALAAKIERHGNCYYKIDDTEKKHPYCLACWDADRKLVSLILSANGFGGNNIRCNVCASRKGA
jgi:hypothetical protein